MFGLVSIEAQALGTPVLGANIGGIPEIIQLGISGELFKAGDIEDMRIKIINMFAKPFDYGKIQLLPEMLFQRRNTTIK